MSEPQRKPRIPSVNVLAQLLDYLSVSTRERILLNYDALRKAGAVPGSDGLKPFVTKTGHSDPIGESVANYDEWLSEIASKILEGAELLKQADIELSRRMYGVKPEHFVRRGKRHLHRTTRPKAG